MGYQQNKEREAINNVTSVVNKLHAHIKTMKSDKKITQQIIADRLGWSGSRLSAVLSKKSIKLLDYLNICLCMEIDPMLYIKEEIPQFRDGEDAEDTELSKNSANAMQLLAKEVAKYMKT
jgi:hypothetical protein